jgi:nucleoside-diphosphate-sugar epimerase
MRAVVSGGTGLLGSRVVTALHQRGYGSTAIARRPSRSGSPHEAQLHLCDLGVEVPATDLFRNADVVVHAAAAVIDWGFWPEYEANTIKATANVLQAMRLAGCRRLVHISTVGVYGRPGTREPIREDHPYTPTGRWDYYARSKIEAERLVWAAQNNGSLDVTVIRPALIYGVHPTGLVAQVAARAKQGKLTMPGDPGTCLPLVHVDDVVSAVVLAATSPVAIGKTYNVVNDEKITQKEFFNTVASLVGGPPVSRRVSYRLAYAIGFVCEVWGHLRHSPQPPPLTRFRVSLFGHRRQYSTEAIRQQLGWRPQVPFADGIVRATESLRPNQA